VVGHILGRGDEGVFEGNEKRGFIGVVVAIGEPYGLFVGKAIFAVAVRDEAVAACGPQGFCQVVGVCPVDATDNGAGLLLENFTQHSINVGIEAGGGGKIQRQTPRFSMGFSHDS